jgi:hypothetical protein
MDVSFALFKTQTVKLLVVAERTESGDVEYLSLASGEECGTMDSGNEVDFTFDRSDLIEFTAGESDMVSKDTMTDLIFDAFVEDIEDLSFVILFTKLSDELFAKFSAARFTGGFGKVGHSDAKFVAADADDFVDEFGIMFDDRSFIFRMTDLSDDGFLELDEFLVSFMSTFDSLENDGLGDFLHAGFDHTDILFGGSNDKVHLTVFHLRKCGIDDEFAVDVTDSAGADRTGKRYAGHTEYEGTADHGKGIGIVLTVGGKDGHDDLDISSPGLRKKRSERSVSDTRSEDSFFSRSAFSSDETAGDLAGCIKLFLIFDCKRKEIDAFLGLGCDTAGHKDHSVAITYSYSSFSLLGQFTALNGKGTASKASLKFIRLQFFTPYRYLVFLMRKNGNYLRRPSLAIRVL